MMNKKIIALIFVVIIAFGTWMLVSYKKGYIDGFEESKSSLSDLHERYDDLSNTTQCGNISKYVTDKGFMIDYDNLLTKAHACPIDNPDPAFSLYNVDYLDNCSDINVDCEDISFMIDCLAREYNYTCDYYTSISIGKENHRGIRCNVSGDELELY